MDFRSLIWLNLLFLQADLSLVFFDLSIMINKKEFKLSQEWKTVYLILSYKGGDYTSIKRFRPLMSLPLMVKVYESALVSNIKHVLIKEELINADIQKAHIQGSSGVFEHLVDVNWFMHKHQQKYVKASYLLL